MAWKRSSVRSRPGPPNSLNSLNIFRLQQEILRFPRKNRRLLCLKDTEEDFPRLEPWLKPAPFSDRPLPSVLQNKETPEINAIEVASARSDKSTSAEL